MLLAVMLTVSLPVGVFAQEIRNAPFMQRAGSEYIYYTDIFYTYPYYLKSNPYLDNYQATTSGVIYNVLSEYVTTDQFAQSVTSQVLDKATSVADVIKYVQSNMNYQDFVFENELDMANRLMLQALSENDAKKGAVDFTKNSSEQIKNFSSLTKLASTLDETTDSLEDAGHLADDIDFYEGLLEVTFDFLGKNAPRLSSKLPDINDGLEAKLGKVFDSVSTIADASEFAAALAVTVMAQEAQLELIYDILNDAPKDSMLYAGMTRLKNQLEGGAVTFFTETYLEEAIYKKVIDKFTDGIIKGISGGFPPIQMVNVVLAVVDVINAVVFKWMLGADYDSYIGAVLLTNYKESLAQTLDNMSDRYASYFISDDIVAYSNVFNAYITVNKAAYDLYCKLSTYNDTYNSTYTATYTSVYEDMTYEKYISEVKAYILSIPEEIREKSNHGTWTLNSDATLREPTDEIALGYCYMPKHFNGNITLSRGSLTIDTGDSFTINGNLNITGSDVKLINNGGLTVDGKLIMGSANSYLYNYGNLNVDEAVLTGYERNSWDYHNPKFYNYGEATVYGDLTMSGTSKAMLFMTEGEPVLRVHGNITGIANNYDVTKGMILLCGSTQQSIDSMSVNNLTVTNPEGIKYTGHMYVKGRYDLCGNTLDNNGYATYLEGSASLAPANDYKTVQINCNLNIEGDIKGVYTVGQYIKVTIPKDVTSTIEGDLNITGHMAELNNNGALAIVGKLVMGTADSYLNNYGKLAANKVELNGYLRNSSDYHNPKFYNYGEATVYGDLAMSGTSKTMLFNSSDDAMFYIGGDFVGNNASGLNKGKVIFDGDGFQSIKNTGKLNVLVIENGSYEGVKFESNIDYTTLFDHKSNRFTVNNISNVDYDGDGMYDRYDPKPTVNEKASIITRDYDVIIGHAGEIDLIRYASGIHENSNSIRNAEDRVDINASVVAENTVNNVYTRNMPDGGVYTFWIRLNDGTTFLRTVDMSRMKQRVSVDGVRITTHNLYGVRDYFIAKGDFNSYNEIKNNGYIFSATAAKLKGNHSYTYTVSNPGRHTVLVRYEDRSRPDEVFKVDLEVVEPIFTVNGLQITIGNIPGVKVIRTAYGEYNTPGDTKRAAGARNFSNKSVIKDANEYTIQYREEGRITIVVEYDNGYVKVFHHTLEQKKPTVEQNGNTVTFGDLDGLVMIRYARGEYSSSSEIKKALGSKAIKPDAIADGKISIALEAGTYTFCVQYDDDSYNYYRITVE